MESFDINALATLAGELVTTWGIRVVGALAVLFIGRAIAGWLRRLTTRMLKGAAVDETLTPFLSSIAYWLALMVVFVAVLGLFGIPTASFIAILGAAGLAVGLALQGTLSSFAAGVMLLVFRPFRVGDLVEVAGHLGVVQSVAIFSTVMNTPDNVRIVLPNSEVFGGAIRNYTANDTRRVDLLIGVDYGDDLAVAQKTIERVIGADERVLEEPPPVVAVHALADSSVNFVVRPWCGTEDYWNVRWELTRRLKEELEAAGCSIPFPQHDIHVIPTDEAAA